MIPGIQWWQADHSVDYEDIEEDEAEAVDIKTEYPCPFCFDDFDIVGLCCHVDEVHPVEAGSGVCPFCSFRAGVNMIGHMTTKHGDIFKLQRKMKLLTSTFSSTKRDSVDRNLPSFSRASSSTMEIDQLVATFLSNVPESHATESACLGSSTELSTEEKNSDQSCSERDAEISVSSGEQGTASPCSVVDRETKARKCEFVQELLLSGFFHDGL